MQNTISIMPHFSYPTPPYTQRAYSQVILPSGQVLRRTVVVFDAEGCAVDHFPLTEELPFVEWHNTTFRF